MIPWPIVLVMLAGAVIVSYLCGYVEGRVETECKYLQEDDDLT